MEHFAQQILIDLEKKPRTWTILLALCIVAIIGWIDDVTGEELHMSILYLTPVMLAAWGAGRPWGIFFCFLCAGVWLWADIHAGGVYSHAFIPIWNAGVQLGFFLIFTNILTALKEALAHERLLAQTDDLTRLANVRAFYSAVSRELTRARRNGTPFSMAYLDLDNFKIINDNRGHAEGDAILRKIGDALHAHIRDLDTAGRLGGDEFAVLYSGAGSEASEIAVGRLRESMAEIMRENLKTLGGSGDENAFQPTCSIGLVSFQSPPLSVDETVRIADQLMYEVKRSGKNGLRSIVWGEDASDGKFLPCKVDSDQPLTAPAVTERDMARLITR